MATIASKFDRTCQLAVSRAAGLKAQAKNSLRKQLEGADTVEYVMMAAIFCLGICIAAFLLRDQVAGIFNAINNNLKTVAGGGNGAPITNK